MSFGQARTAFRQVHTVAKLAITVLVGVFMFLNIMPWITVAQQMASNLPALVGVFNWLYDIPLIGWLIRAFVESFSTVCGFVLWLTVQSIQILPTLIERPQVLYPLITSWDGVELSEKADRKRMNELKKRFNDSLVNIIDNLKLYRAGAYVVEALVCLYVYPPYTGGWVKLIEDYPVLDWDLVSFPNIISAIVTMFAFEILFRITLNLWGLNGIVKFGPKIKEGQSL